MKYYGFEKEIGTNGDNELFCNIVQHGEPIEADSKKEAEDIFLCVVAQEMTDVMNIVSKTRNTYVIFDEVFKKIFVSEYFVSEECACRKDAWSW